MEIIFLTLFPEQCRQYFLKGIFGKKAEEGLFSCRFVDLRDFASPPHRKVDSYPYGKRQGMLLRADVIQQAIKSIDYYRDYRLLYMCPKGRQMDQAMVQDLSTQKGLIILSGYYEGVDERIFDLFDIERVSVGPLVLSSGDSPAALLAEATLRLLPGVIENPNSVADDSILSHRLEAPHYTAPVEVDGLEVPDLVRSGNHGKIDAWKQAESLRDTLFKQPTLFLESNGISQSERDILTSIVKEQGHG